jgi:hypothetical protein
MFNKHHLRMKLSDLEFVEELSEVELRPVAGGTSVEIADKLIKKVLDNLSQRRAEAESQFKKEYPELAPLIFSNED